MQIIKIRAKFAKEIVDALAAELTKGIPEEDKAALHEMAETWGEINNRADDAKAIPSKLVEKFNSLCYKLFPEEQDGEEFAKEEAPEQQKMKAMISQPMAGMDESEISATRERAIKILEKMGYEVINTMFTDEWYSDKSMQDRGVKQKPLCFLAKSLENMALCDVAFFCDGWDETRGCRIEHEAAKQYGLTILYEDDFKTKETRPVSGVLTPGWRGA